MTDLAELTNEEVIARSRHWRSQALRGVIHARGFAHEYEVEVRRRFPCPTTICGTLETRAPQRRSWLHFWKR